MSERKLFTSENTDSASDKEILLKLGYNPKRHHIVKREDGPCGGGGDDSCYVTIELGASKEEDEEE